MINLQARFPLTHGNVFVALPVSRMRKNILDVRNKNNFVDNMGRLHDRAPSVDVQVSDDSRNTLTLIS